MTSATFPFGRPSTPRPPRKPSGNSEVFVLGVYPSALHVRWTPSKWTGLGAVGALAVDDEPTVFWDGADADTRIEAWKQAVDFKVGDAEGDWGHVRSAMNGTSGASIADRILNSLGVDPSHTWFTDVIDRFFIKSGAGGRRQQAEVMRDVYGPFASKVGLPPANLPARPSVTALVNLGVTEQRDRLRSELQEAAAPMVVTLGEEARQVLAAVGDECAGPPCAPLSGKAFAGDGAKSYGAPGSVQVGNAKAQWMALVHPGQRSAAWKAVHDNWVQRQNGG